MPVLFIVKKGILKNTFKLILVYKKVFLNNFSLSFLFNKKKFKAIIL